MKNIREAMKFQSKSVSGIVLAILLTGILTLAFDVQPVAAVDWWPMFHHDSNHTGYSTSTGSDTNNVVWTYPNVYVESSPAVADGKVYFGSYDNKIYCLDAETGNFNWSFTTGHWKNISSPAVADGKVYVGSYDHKVYCLRASDGHKEWEFTTALYVHSSPTVAYGKVYVASMYDGLYCLPQNDPDNNGVIDPSEVIWFFGSSNFQESSPAVADDKVFIGKRNGVLCFNAANGDGIWDYATGAAVESSPAVVDGKVYVGSDDHYVYCLRASDGHKEWKFETDDAVKSSPAVADGKVYVGSNDGTVYCLDAEGGPFGTTDEIWSYPIGGYVTSSPAVADGKVYVASTTGEFCCLNASTGSLIWSYESVFGPGVSSPAVVDGIVYAGGLYDDKFYAFGPPPYDVTIQAYCYAEGAPVSVSITMDGSPTGYYTPYTFTDLAGTHTFTVPDNDPNGHPFEQWSTGETSTTIIVSSAGTYTAYYREPTYDVTIEAYCYTCGGPVSVSIALDGSPTEYYTPHIFHDLTGTHTFTVPDTDPNEHPFVAWSTGETSTTVIVSSAGTYTAYYRGLVPTLTEWGLIILVVLIILSAWVVLRRRRAVVSS